ncbi:MAG: DUF393 domain-containing protein [Paludibacteraceae bacterium]|nr:DUF393 domain-containing protein [Paludibacteraceae bacterium]
MIQENKPKEYAIIFVYDNGCIQCTRTAGLMKRWDWLDKISPVPLRNGKEINQFHHLNTDLAQKELAVFYKNKWSYGFNSIVLIFQQLPVFWISLPLLYVLKWSRIGDFLYRKTAIKRVILPEYCKIE